MTQNKEACPLKSAGANLIYYNLHRNNVLVACTFVEINKLTLSFLHPLLCPQPGAKMVTAAKATVPTIGDQASAMQLSQCAKNLATALAELRTAAQKVPNTPQTHSTRTCCLTLLALSLVELASYSSLLYN